MLLPIAIAGAVKILANAAGLDEPESPPEPETSPEFRVLEISADGYSKFDDVVDVLVVGAGAAGLSAAVGAKYTAPTCRVRVLDAAENAYASTSSLSGGLFWIPNNHIMDAEDTKHDCVRHMASTGFPESFNATKSYKQCFGLSRVDFDRLVNFYETGRSFIELLSQDGWLPHLTNPKDVRTGETLSELSAPTRFNAASAGGRGLMVGMHPLARKFYGAFVSVLRVVEPVNAFLGKHVHDSFRELSVFPHLNFDVSGGNGASLTSTLLHAATSFDGVDVEYSTRVVGVVRDVHKLHKPVVGVVLRDGRLIGARRGVVFATGGFSQNSEMVSNAFGDKASYASSAGKHAKGDVNEIAARLDVATVRMDAGLLGECFVEKSLGIGAKNHDVISTLHGDALFLVNSNGERVVDEKSPFDVRSAAHHSSPENALLYLISSEKCAATFASNILKTFPRDVESSALYVRGDTIQELAIALRARVTALSLGSKPQKFDPRFVENLTSTFNVFNSSAQLGIDKDFGRGDSQSSKEWSVVREDQAVEPPRRVVNHTMAKLEGPLVALVLAPALLDTYGGPKVDVHQRFLTASRNASTGASEEVPIPGMYGVGSAAAPILGKAPYAGGNALGAALVSGYAAGVHVALESRSVGSKL